MTDPIEPIHLSFAVECAAADAFTISTAYTSPWWRITHSVSTQPGLEVVFEPRVGGRIFERTPGGEEHDWGEIVEWDPPHRLRYLWRIATDRGHATDVAIAFHTLPALSTRVDVEHSGWER